LKKRGERRGAQLLGCCVRVGWGTSEGGKRVGRGCRLGQREEERGEGEVWAFGPISRDREEEKNKYFSNFIFRALLN